MKTIILDETKPENILKAGEILKNGGLVAIPTETVYGLAANALDPNAVKSIFSAKGRPNDNPLIVHISDFSELSALVTEIPENAVRLADAFWPGPLTIILPKSDIVPSTTSGGLNTVAVRFPSNKTALNIIKAAQVPLAAPSANLSGKPSPTTFGHVYNDLFGKVDAIIKGKDCNVGLESTVISLVGGEAKLLRPGGITRQQLEAVLGFVEVDSAVISPLKKNKPISSPGMKYKHYSPKANITIIDSSPYDFIDFVNDHGKCHALCFEEDVSYLNVPCVTFGKRYDSETQANQLFSALHKLDEKDAKTVFARIPSKNGVGLAVYNRLVRASGFKIINPKNSYIIGLTGPSGSGKTTVCKTLETLGCHIIDCDKISKSPDVYDKNCISQLQKTFGNDIVKNGILDRRKLGEIAFSSPENTQKLNEITHPRILSKVLETIKKAQSSGEKFIILDAPTLFEAKLDDKCSRIITVIADEKLRIKRIMARDNLSIENVKKRFSAQKSDSFYISKSDHIINCNDDIDLIKRFSPIINGLSEKLSP